MLWFGVALSEVKLSYDPVCPCVDIGWSVCLSDSHNFRDGEFHFHAPIGAIVINRMYKTTNVIVTLKTVIVNHKYVSTRPLDANIQRM